jgi:hypothetical protein
MVIVQLSIVFWVNVYQNWVDLVRMNFSSNSQARRHAQIAHVVSHPRHTMMKHRKEITCCIAVKASEKSPRERWRQFVLIIVPRCSQHRNYDSFFSELYLSNPTSKSSNYQILSLPYPTSPIHQWNNHWKTHGTDVLGHVFPNDRTTATFFLSAERRSKIFTWGYIYIYNLVIWQFAMENPPIFNG